MSGSGASPDRAQRVRQWRRGHRPPAPGLDRGLALIVGFVGLVALAPRAASALGAALEAAMQPHARALDTLRADIPALLGVGGVALLMLVGALAVTLASAVLSGRLGPVRRGPAGGASKRGGAGAVGPSSAPAVVIAALAAGLILDGVVASAARSVDATSSGLAAALGAWALRVAAMGGGALLLVGAVQRLQGRWAVDRAAMAEAAASRGRPDRAG